MAKFYNKTEAVYLMSKISKPLLSNFKTTPNCFITWSLMDILISKLLFKFWELHTRMLLKQGHFLFMDHNNRKIL